MPLFEILSIALIGLSPAIGSFIGVLVDRLTRGEDVIAAPSACRRCGQRLGLRDLVPVVSFVGRRGRCGYCHGLIPAWVLYIELLAIGAAVLAVIATDGDASHMVLTAVFLWLLLALGMTDALWFRLPDVLTGLLALAAFGLAWGPQGIGVQAVWGAAIGAGSFAVLRLCYAALRGREGLGLGDVKLMVGLGAFSGPMWLPWLVLLAALAALGVTIMRSVLSANKLSGQTALPFGTALCAAGFCIWIVLAVSSAG